MAKKIYVAVDAGFDGAKIYVNGRRIHLPATIQDITNEAGTYDLRRVDNNFIKTVINNRTYILGEVARTYLLNKDRGAGKETVMEGFYTMDRFRTNIFESALSSYIAYALYRYSVLTQDDESLATFNLSELSEYEIKVGVALPHNYTEELIDVMDGYLDKQQVLDLIVGNNEAIHFDYKISETIYNSQAICALLNEVLDENGDDVEGDSPYEHLPLLVLVAGYKTIEEFEFARDESITGDDSNVRFAMMNINDSVAEEIRRKVPGYFGYMIDELVRKDEVIHYLDENNKVQDIAVRPLRESAFNRYSKEFMEHLLQKYNNLLDTKMILVAGGTGKLYYDYIKSYCEENRPYLKDMVKLGGQRGFGKDPCEPIFCVACGLYKDMLMQLGPINDEE